ncbi:hypothetical protein D3C81_1587640 [compost metagenome]
MQDDNVIFLRKIDQVIIEAIRCQCSSGVIGVRYNHKFSLSRDILRNILETDHIAILFLLRHEIELGACQQGPIREHGVARIGDKYQIAFINDG